MNKKCIKLIHEKVSSRCVNILCKNCLPKNFLILRDVCNVEDTVIRFAVAVSRFFLTKDIVRAIPWNTIIKNSLYRQKKKKKKKKK